MRRGRPGLLGEQHTPRRTSGTSTSDRWEPMMYPPHHRTVRPLRRSRLVEHDDDGWPATAGGCSQSAPNSGAHGPQGPGLPCIVTKIASVTCARSMRERLCSGRPGVVVRRIDVAEGSKRRPPRRAPRVEQGRDPRSPIIGRRGAGRRRQRSRTSEMSGSAVLQHELRRRAGVALPPRSMVLFGAEAPVQQGEYRRTWEIRMRRARTEFRGDLLRSHRCEVDRDRWSCPVPPCWCAMTANAFELRTARIRVEGHSHFLSGRRPG
jgi:hypothetical protein